MNNTSGKQEKILFKENKRPVVDNSILFVLTLIANIIFLQNSLFMILPLIPFDSIVLVVLLGMKLKIKITEDAILYKFFPFHFGWRQVKKEDMSEISLVSYQAIGNFNGTGRRNIPYKKLKAYTTAYSGFAIKITNKPGLSIFLGVKEMKEVEAVISQWPQFKAGVLKLTK